MAVRRKRLSDEEILAAIIDKMFKIAGHDVTYNDIKDRKDDWYRQWTMTVEQNEEWKRWVAGFLRKERRWPKYRAIKEADWLSFMYGLKFSNYEYK